MVDCPWRRHQGEFLKWCAPTGQLRCDRSHRHTSLMTTDSFPWCTKSKLKQQKKTVMIIHRAIQCYRKKGPDGLSNQPQSVSLLLAPKPRELWDSSLSDARQGCLQLTQPLDRLINGKAESSQVHLGWFCGFTAAQREPECCTLELILIPNWGPPQNLCWNTVCQHSAAISPVQCQRGHVELVEPKVAVIDFWALNWWVTDTAAWHSLKLKCWESKLYFPARVRLLVHVLCLVIKKCPAGGAASSFSCMRRRKRRRRSVASIPTWFMKNFSTNWQSKLE